LKVSTRRFYRQFEVKSEIRVVYDLAVYDFAVAGAEFLASGEFVCGLFLLSWNNSAHQWRRE
jgi:hypothetical protein